MTDRVRQLFDRLDAEPSAEFEASLRTRILGELSTAGGAPPVDFPEPEPEEIFMITETPEAPSTQRRTRRTTFVLAALAAAAALVVAVVLATRDTGTDGPADQPTTLPDRDAIPAPSALARRTTLTDDRIRQVVSDGTNLWAGTDSTDLLRIDPATGQVAETLTLPAAMAGVYMNTHDGDLYVITRAGVVIVDGTTKSVSEPRATKDVAGLIDIAFTADSAWIFNNTGRGNVLQRWDVALTTMVREVNLGGEPLGSIASDGTSLYAISDSRGLLRFDGTGNEVAAIGGGYPYCDAKSGAGSVWVPDGPSGQLLRVDPTTNSIVARISVDTANVCSLAVTDTSVWVAMADQGLLVAIDPATNAKTAEIAAPTATSVAVLDGVVWVAGRGVLDSFVPA